MYIDCSMAIDQHRRTIITCISCHCKGACVSDSSHTLLLLGHHWCDHYASALGYEYHVGWLCHVETSTPYAFSLAPCATVSCSNLMQSRR